MHGGRELEPVEHAAGQEERLVGGGGRSHQHGLPRCPFDDLRGASQRVIPVDGHKLARFPNERCLEPISVVHQAVRGPPVVAHEVLIDLEVGTRPHPHDRMPTRVEIHVAALRTPDADARRAVELPGAGLVQEILGEEGADRAEVHDVTGPRVIQLTIRMNANERAVPALGDVQDRVVGRMFHEAHTARAQDTPVRDVQDIATKILHRIEPFRVGGGIARRCLSLLKDVVLQLALTGLIANGAIERVVDQQELQHTLAGPLRLV